MTSKPYADQNWRAGSSPSKVTPAAASSGAVPHVHASSTETRDHKRSAALSFEQELLLTISKYVGDIMARSVLIHVSKMCGIPVDALSPTSAAAVAQHFEKSLRLYIHDTGRRNLCVSEIKDRIASRKAKLDPGSKREIPIIAELDIVVARNAGRDICKKLGFSIAGQTRVATAISELARNIVLYTPGGTIELSTFDLPQRGICIIARDTGTGIPGLEDVLAGRYVSRTGMGKGLAGTRQLVDIFSVRTGATGTEVIAKKFVNT